MIFEKNVRVKTPYGGKFFENFHFQKHAPNMENWRVKKFQNSKISFQIYW